MYLNYFIMSWPDSPPPGLSQQRQQTCPHQTGRAKNVYMVFNIAISHVMLFPHVWLCNKWLQGQIATTRRP